jgi:hypothetical protein
MGYDHSTLKKRKVVDILLFVFVVCKNYKQGILPLW